MTYFEFFSKYSDMFYYLTFLLGVTNISYNFFEYLSFSHKYDSSQLSKLEGRIHMRLNDIENKIDALYKIKLCETNNVVSDSDSMSETNKDENIMNEENSDYEIEEDNIINEEDNIINEEHNIINEEHNDYENISDCDCKEELNKLEYIDESEENVCVGQKDINDYFKDKFVKNKQTGSLYLGSIFRGWY